MVAEKVIFQEQCKRVNLVSNEDVTDGNNFKFGGAGRVGSSSDRCKAPIYTTHSRCNMNI